MKRLIAISRMAKRSLEDENGYINGTPVDWWEKNKWACSWCLLCMIAQIPIVILRFILMVICFIPYKIYEYLEDMIF